MDDASDTDEPDTTPGETADSGDADAAAPGDDTDRVLEREVLTAAADDDAIADRAIAELRAAVTGDPAPGAGESPTDGTGTDETTTDGTETDEPTAHGTGTDESAVGGSAADESATRRGESEIPTDTLFELLASPGNRFVLTYLLRADNPTTYADLVDYVVERADPPADTTDAKFRGRVAARLVHNTLPDLADAGLIEHDSEAQTVRAAPAIETAAPHLALAMSRSVPGDDAE